MITQTYNIDLIPSSLVTLVRASQYDTNLRTLVFNLYDDGTLFDATGYTVKLGGTKPDKTGFLYDMTVSGSQASIIISEQMTAVSGPVVCEITVYDGNGGQVSTVNFILQVERSALAGTEISETDIPLLQQAIDASEVVISLSETFGSPLVAHTAAEMTLTNRVYVYTGSESGYVNGNWYYYDGTAWVSGGTYNSIVNIDTALSTSSTNPVQNKAIATEVEDLKTDLYTIEGGVINGLFVGSNIKTSGATTSNTARLRTNRMSRAGREVVKLANGDYEYCAFGYSDEGYSDWQNTYLGENTGWINGAYPLYIPDTYEYYALTFRRVDLAVVSSTDADAISSTIKTYNTEVSNAIIDELNYLVPVGNNLIPLKDFHGVVNGVTIDINNGVLSLRGTSTGYIRAKLSGGFYELNYNARQEWATERLSGFESGEYFSLHNEILYGTLPSNAGVTLRDDSGSVILSASVPQTLLSATPAYVMLYIPTQTNVNVDFIPMIIKGTLGAKASSRILNKSVHISAEQILDLTYEMPDMTLNFIYNSTHESAMKFPSAYAVSGEPTPLIILCHGLDSTISSSSWGGTDMTNLVNGFVENGFAVIDVNQVTTQDWCNPSLIEKYVKAITDAVTRYNVEPKIIFAESMGGLIGLCLSTLYHEVKALVVSGLRLDLSARYADLTAEQQAIVDANLGFTNGYDAYIAAGWDKCAIACVDANGNGINPNQFPPTLFVVGTTDTYNTESLQKVDEIKRGGTICKTSEYEGNHNAVSYLKAGTSFTDAIAWMNKWC